MRYFYQWWKFKKIKELVLPNFMIWFNKSEELDLKW
jgi:hypothetical protein